MLLQRYLPSAHSKEVPVHVHGIRTCIIMSTCMLNLELGITIVIT